LTRGGGKDSPARNLRDASDNNSRAVVCAHLLLSKVNVEAPALAMDKKKPPEAAFKPQSSQTRNERGAAYREPVQQAPSFVIGDR
jgi:hypothetical protein